MKKIVVVGGGISGLATAYAIINGAGEASLEIDLTLIESENRLGGKIQSERVDGFLCEGGPNGFLDNKPETLELCSKLNLDNSLLRCNESAAKRFIYSNGILHQLPASPLGFLGFKLISLKGKLRILKEPFTKPISYTVDETIADFGRRHLGPEATEKLIDPMVSGIFAGDTEKLSLKSCFPIMMEIERAGKGSLVKGMINRMKEAKKEKQDRGSVKKGGGPMGPGGKLTSFADGVEVLVNSLVQELKENIIIGKKVTKVEKQNGEKPYKVFIEKGDPIEADIVVAAVPAYAAARILENIDSSTIEGLKKVPYPSVNVVIFGYPKEKISHPLDGFGFLIPGKEKRKILGCLWTSSTFNGQAPQGYVSLRTILGGARNSDICSLDDNDTIKTVQEELKSITGISADPSFIKIYRHEKAIPQYMVGHNDFLSDIEGFSKVFPGLFFTGNAYRGIGINDCTRSALITGRKVIDFLRLNRR